MSESLGGYEDGYAACECFWGRRPGSLIIRLLPYLHNPFDLAVLDAGCGEGKNAIYLARRGARVRAIDICPAAIENGRRVWPDSHLVTWEVGDIRATRLLPESFAVVIAYGLLHCLSTRDEVHKTVEQLKTATMPGGYNVICAFNARFQDFGLAHPALKPVLLEHASYAELYSDWSVLHESDENLHETHVHNSILHGHSLTRLIARK
jgi:2-polyprenyl-3-methyl-5-hydroxy-6-metoxy-1,4-benzoquinol methylase